MLPDSGRFGMRFEWDGPERIVRQLFDLDFLLLDPSELAQCRDLSPWRNALAPPLLVCCNYRSLGVRGNPEFSLRLLIRSAPTSP